MQVDADRESHDANFGVAGEAHRPETRAEVFRHVRHGAQQPLLVSNEVAQRADGDVDAARVPPVRARFPGAMPAQGRLLASVSWR